MVGLHDVAAADEEGTGQHSLSAAPDGVDRVRRPQYRLRVGETRVFYDISNSTVEILAIVTKSKAEAWLRQLGDPV